MTRNDRGVRTAAVQWWDDGRGGFRLVAINPTRIATPRACLAVLATARRMLDNRIVPEM